MGGSKKRDCDIWGRVRSFLAGNSCSPMTRKLEANLKMAMTWGMLKALVLISELLGFSDIRGHIGHFVLAL